MGPPKIGKSWFVLALSLAVARGGRGLGCIDVEPRPVLYLALENGDRRLPDCCRKLLDREPIPPGFHYLTRLTPGAVVETIATWVRTYPGMAPPLVILDTLGKVMPAAAPGGVRLPA